MANNFINFFLSSPHFIPHYFGFGRLNSALREKIFVKVSQVNGAIVWYTAHTNVIGKVAGLTKEDMASLWDLDSANLDQKELAALRYAEQLALNKGRIINPDIISELKNFYPEKEIKYIYHEWATVNGFNWIFNNLFTFLHKLRLVPNARLKNPDSNATSCSL